MTLEILFSFFSVVFMQTMLESFVPSFLKTPTRSSHCELRLIMLLLLLAFFFGGGLRILRLVANQTWSRALYIFYYTY